MKIELNNLKKQYNSNVVLDVPTLAIGSGELVGLVGNNGAGKTTMMRLMLDLIKATSGSVTVDTMNVAEDPSWKSVTGSYLDSTFLIDIYTPEEFFGFVAEAYDISEQDLKLRLQEYETLMNGEILGTGKLIHDFSNGNRQKIGIIAAMLVNPQLLILDEPFNYLDPSSQIVVAKLIRKMKRDLGTTVVVSSHNLNSINDICDRILLLDKGRVLMDKPHVPGSTDQELEDYFLDAVK
ncbi:MAG: ABC transporter ATP-binding protein [Bacteroidales bacterium]|nr:ABC transporter ATP-binding protein [Bacteroidales bacterium]